MIVKPYPRSFGRFAASASKASRAFSSRPSLHKPSNPNSQSSAADLLAVLSPPKSSRPTPRRTDGGVGILDNLTSRMQRQGSIMQTAKNELSRVEQARRAKGVERQQFRPWREGDVYAPHDLSQQEMKKWSKHRPPKADVFDVLNINPLDEYKNLPLMMDFMTSMGRIKHQRDTGLRPVNQRKIAKAIRRSMCLGFLPRVHAHPEMLRRPGPWSRQG